MNYDSVHQSIILQHAYLTNGIADFVKVLGPALTSGLDKLETHLGRKSTQPVQPPSFVYDAFDIRQYVGHIRARADAELQQRQRMLDRIDMYLQVVR